MVPIHRDTATRFLLSSSELLIVDVWPDDSKDVECGSKEWAVDFVNSAPGNTTFELFSLATSVSGDPGGCHMVILRHELQAWQDAAREHGVRLVPTRAPIKHSTWDGGARLVPCPQGAVILELPH